MSAKEKFQPDSCLDDRELVKSKFPPEVVEAFKREQQAKAQQPQPARTPVERKQRTKTAA